MYCQVVLILFLSFKSFTQSEFFEKPKGNDWINPLDGFFSDTTHSEKILGDKVKESVNTLIDSSPDENVILCNSFLKRFVNVMLQAIGLQNQNSFGNGFKEISMKLKVSEDALNVLQKFGSGEPVPYDELDENLIQFLKFEIDDSNKNKNDNIGYISFLFGPLHTLGDIFSDVEIYTLSVLFILLVSYGILRGRISLSSVIYYLLVVYYVLSVVLDLWNQYEDVYNKRILTFEETFSHGGKVKIPDECFPSKMTTWEKLFNMYIYKDDTCERYLKSKKSLWTEIEVQKAFSRPLSGLFLSFLPEFGDVAGKSVKNFSDHFMFPFNLVMPILLVYLLIGMLPALFRYSRMLRFSVPYTNSDGTNQITQGSSQTVSPVTINFHNQISPPIELGSLTENKETRISKPLKDIQKKRMDRKRAWLYSRCLKIK